MHTLLFFLFVIAVVIAYRYGVSKGMDRQRALEMHYPTKAANYDDCILMAKEISSFLGHRMMLAKPLAFHFGGELEAMQAWESKQRHLWARHSKTKPSDELLDFVRYTHALGCSIEIKQVA